MTNYRTIITFILTLFCMLIPPISTQNKTFVNYVLSEQSKMCKPDSLCGYNGTYLNKRCRLCFDCQCDNDCRRYGDCCPDVAPLVVSAPNTTTTAKQYHCQNETFKLIKFRRPEYLFFCIAKCSSFVDPQLVSLCHNPNSSNLYMNRPATSDSEVYRNEFCAQCNGETKYKLWNFRFDCSASIAVPLEISADEIVNYFVNHTKCSVFYEAPDSTYPRRCYVDSSNIISSCNETGLWRKYDEMIHRACNAYYSPLAVETINFKNLFCFYCNSREIYKPATLCMFNTPYPFSVLMDPDASRRIMTKTQQRCQCRDNEVFDRFKKTCRQLTCSFGRKLEGKKCVSIYTRSRNCPYSVEVTLTPVDDIDMDPADAYAWINSIISNIETTFKTKTKGYTIDTHMVGFRLLVKFNATKIFKIFFLMKFLLKSEVNPNIFENLLIEIRHSYWIIVHDDGSLLNMSSAGSQTLSNSEISYHNLQFSVVPQEYYLWTYAQVNLHRDNNFASEPLSYTAVTNILTCPLLQLDLNETKHYSRTDQTLVLVVTNTTLNSDEFLVVENGTVSICQDIVTGTMECPSLSPELIFSTEYIIVSTACQGVSLVCLFMTLIMFFLFPQLRSLPGKTTMGLIFTLFFTVGLNLFGISRVENAIVCKLIAVLIHFFLLSSFTWMGICSFHMYRVFKNMTMSKKSLSEERKRFALYLTVSVLIPLSINAAVIGSNYAVHGASDIGYGLLLCYVSNFYSIILGVILPVSMVVLFNLVLFVLTVVSLRTMSMEHHGLTGKKENVYTYIKLSTLTGLNWLSAFIAALTGVQALWYVFAVLCGLQGVYIFLAFVCNKRVFTMFKELCRGSGKGLTGTKRDTSTTGSGKTGSSSLSKNNSLEHNQQRNQDMDDDKPVDESTTTDF